jgi:hypothetical protein
MSNFKKGYYKADTVNGVWYYGDILDEPNTDIMRPEAFYAAIRHLEAGEVLTTFLGPEDEEVYEVILDEYGITL